MSPARRPTDTLDFSNAVLRAWLNYARRDDSLFKELLRDLNVDLAWLEDEVQWHSADFHQLFIETFLKIYGEDSLTTATREMFERKGFKLAHSAIGLLVTPKIFFSQLPRMAKRMNHYNRLSFNRGGGRLTRSSGTLIQEYAHRDRQILNAHLCEACRASAEGVFKALGHRLLMMTEEKCIKKGDDHCAFRMEWVHRLSLVKIILAVSPFLFFVSAWALDVLPSGYWASSTDRSLTATILAILPMACFGSHYLSRRRLHEAFDYQQETLDHLRRSMEMQQKVNRMLVEYQSQYEKTMALTQIGEMSYGIVHDMASPISLIRLTSELIDRRIAEADLDNSTVDFQKNFAMIKKSTDRLMMLQNLLRRAVSQSSSNPWVEIDLAQMVRDTVHLYKVAAMKANVALEWHCDYESICIKSKEGHVERSLINLLNNALNALRTHHVRRIDVHLSRAADGSWHLVVIDSGPGIPPERLGRLFERLGPSSKPSTRREGGEVMGTGWGLYSIQSLMQDMGASFQLSSQSTGTKANLIFPASLQIHEPVVKAAS